MDSKFRRFASLLLLFTPLALTGESSGEARVKPAPAREARTFTSAPLATAGGAESDERSESAVVLVVLDGVRWQEVFRGADPARMRGAADAAALMPNLHRMIDEEGVAIGAPDHGAEIDASGPQFISLPGYIEIFSGMPDPACGKNDCTPAPARTLVDDLRGAGGPEDAIVVSSWPNIARAATRAPADVEMSAGRKLLGREDLLRADPESASLLEEGERAKPFPGDGDYRPDAYTEKVALRRLVAGRPRFLFVGLGDADEYAHRGDYRGYLGALRGADEFLGDLTETLRTMGARGRHTTVIVTADHGRAKNFTDHGPQFPESGRVWLVAAGGDIAGPAHDRGDHGLVAASRRHTLSDVAPTVRALLGQTRQTSETSEASMANTAILEIVR